MKSNHSEIDNVEALVKKGHYPQAEDKIRVLLKKQINSEKLQNLLGVSLIQQNKFEESVTVYKKLIKENPSNVFAHNNLAISLMKLKKLDDAITRFKEALLLDPKFNQASINLAEIYVLKNDRDKVEFYLNQLIENNPKTEEVLMNVAETFIKIKNIDKAIQIYHLVSKLEHNQFKVLNNLGRAHHIKGEFNSAIEKYLSALNLNPKSSAAYYNLASSYMKIKNYKLAITNFKKSIEIDPKFYKSYANLGIVYMSRVENDKAEIEFKKSLEIQPNVASYNNLSNIMLNIGEFEKAIFYRKEALKISPYESDVHSNYLFDMQYDENFNPKEYLNEAKKYKSTILSINKDRIKKFQFDRHPKKLKVGFVSGDFGRHPGGFFLLNTIRNLKNKNLELYAYSTYERSDEVASEFKSLFDFWRNIDFKPDIDVINEIRDDGIHILIDSSGHTKGNKLSIFPFNPAPIQATYLSPGSTGISEIDYFLGSPHLTPDEEKDHFAEKIWKLPEVLQCFTPPIYDLQTKELPALKNKYITFGSLNKFSKLSPGALKLWSQVLNSIKNSRILIKFLQIEYKGIKEKIVNQFEKSGINPNNIIFVDRTEHRDQALELYNSIDINLDTFPFQGNTTTCEAAWMGVPTLTLKGDRFLFHFGEAINANLGLKDWIAENKKDFVEKSKKLTEDISYLSELRKGLRNQLLKSPICDAPRLANHFDKMLWDMWKNFSNNL